MSSRERGDSGEFKAESSVDDVVAVFHDIRGPVVTSRDVAEALDCSPETARTKLDSLVEEGRAGRRSVAGRNLYWLTDHETQRLSLDDAFMERDTFESGDEGVSRDVDEHLYGDWSG